MSSEPIKAANVTTINSITTSDRLMVVGNTAGTPDIFTITVGNLTNLIRVINTPANSTALTIPQNVLATDGSYLYVSTANNVLARVALSDF